MAARAPRWFSCLAALLFLVPLLVAQAAMAQAARPAADADAKPPLRTQLGGEYWGYELTEEYLDYLAQVRPDLIHGGVLGPELASTVFSPPDDKAKAITPIFPAAPTTMRGYHEAWKAYLPRVQAHGIQVQNTFSLVNAWGDHEANTGWFKYYRDLWEEDLLGPRPAADVADLMERDAAGGFLRDGQPGWYRYGGCVNNPHWRAALRAMVKAGIEAGFDGFMVQYPHARGPCACEHCQTKFRAFLQERYGAGVLERRFGIADIDQHRFERTGPRMSPGRPSPIEIEARQFGIESVKDCFDDVFVRYGRSLKPDLIVSLWSHYRNFLEPDVMQTEEQTNTEWSGVTDERLLLPLERWGRDEDYLWYCSPVYASKIAKGLLGDSTLDYRYTRAMAGDTPFVIQKYDYFRWRSTAGEAMAHGGIAWGAWKGGWSGGSDREDPHLKTYFRFIRERDEFLRPRESAAEAALLYPRTALFSGDATFLEPVRRLGAGLMSGRVLFDMVIDEKMTLDAMMRYRLVVVPTQAYLTDAQRRMLDQFVAAGGCLVALPAAPPPPTPATADAPAEADMLCRCGVEGVGQPDAQGQSVVRLDLKDRVAVGEALRRLAGPGLSNFEAPWTVQIAADRQPAAGRTIVHFVNYNRDESQPGKELPIAAEPVGVDLAWPAVQRVQRVRFFTPEVAGEQEIRFTQDAGRVRFTTPPFLAYGMAVVETR